MAFIFENLFNTTIPNELAILCELIDNIQTSIDERDIRTKWAGDKYFNQYGFEIRSADQQKTLFFGLWYSLWETKGLPLCITLDWTATVDNSVGGRFMELHEHEKHLAFEFDEYPLIAFRSEYLQSLDSIEPILYQLQLLCDRLKFNLYFKK